MFVVYFNQHLGAAHFQRWLKYEYFTFFAQKPEKRKKKQKVEAKWRKFAKDDF